MEHLFLTTLALLGISTIILVSTSRFLENEDLAEMGFLAEMIAISTLATPMKHQRTVVLKDTMSLSHTIVESLDTSI